MKFGVGLPTCTAGMMYPVPFASAEDIVRVAIEAEQLGYYEVAGNDHFTTQQYVREAFTDPPDFFDPLISYAYCAAKTSVLRLMTGIIVVPMRHPIVLAKQLATLDRFSGGRLLVGAGIGAYREELETAFPDLAGVRRADLMRESLVALRILLEERRATFDGAHIRFHDIEMYPKPVQDPLPIYSAGNSDGGSLAEGDRRGQGETRALGARGRPRPIEACHRAAADRLHRRERRGSTPDVRRVAAVRASRLAAAFDAEEHRDRRVYDDESARDAGRHLAAGRGA